MLGDDICLVYVLMCDTLDGEGLFLVLCSGISHHRAWRIICGTSDQTWVSHIQGNSPIYYSIFLAPQRFLYSV